MAQLITVRLSRNDGCPWGFRLQGGKDFGTALVIQKVNGGSPAEKAGLIAGDSVVKVNNTDVFNLRHKDAQDVIVRAGQSFEMTVQRGGSTWKPSVTPVGNLPRTQPMSNNVSPVTKTSLAAKNESYTPIGATHNLSPKGFSAAPHMNGDGPKLVNKQYNSPIGIYSEQTIAETLSAQAEVLSTGALGVNFKKNEKTYNADKSEVLKMLQEVEKEPRSPEPARHDVYSTMSHAIGGRATTPRSITPQPQQQQQQHQIRNDSSAVPINDSQTQENPICCDCERLIVGVFVRIKEKNLHVECFKCATCGTSLKNVGYYNINNKLYCDIHAKLAARSNPPAPNLVPVTIPPGGKVPAGTISAALASHSLPSPSPLSPSGNQVAAPFQTGSSFTGPKPFSSVQPSTPTHAPVVPPLSNTLPRSASSTAMPERKEWPPTKPDDEIPTACPLYISPSTRIPTPQLLSNQQMSIPQSNPPPPPPPLPETHNPYPQVFIPQPQKPHPLMRNPHPQISQIPVLQNPHFQTNPQNYLPLNPNSQNPILQVGNPHPQIIVTQKPIVQNPISQNPNPHNPNPQNPNPQNLNPQNPTLQNPLPHNPMPQNILQNPPPIINTIESKTTKSQMEEYNSKQSSYEMTSLPPLKLDHQTSICSAEVTNITGRKSVMECVDTITDSIDTQILVSKLTKERPKSPPPLHRKDSVLEVHDNVYETQDISVVVSTKLPDKRPVKKNDEPVISIDSRSNSSNNDVCCNKPCQKSATCQMNNPECQVNVVRCPQNGQASASNAQMSQPVEFTTSLVNNVPKGYISPMVKALTVASDRPFNTVAVTIKSTEYDRPIEREAVETQIMQESYRTQEAKTQSQEIKMMQENVYLQESKAMQQTKIDSSETKFPHEMAPPAASPFASALTIAPSVPFTPASNILEPVPFPEETVPYFPPEHPIETKVEADAATSKSPFINALTTDSDRPYSPMVSGFGVAQDQKSDISDFMKDIPKPGKQKLSMLAALTTASDRPFTPALSVSSVGDSHEMEQIQISDPQLKPEPKKIEPPKPINIKPASHNVSSPSAFRPIGTTAQPFKPVCQSYQPQRQRTPKPVYTSSTPYNYSTPSTAPIQQNNIYQTSQISQYSQQQQQQQQQMQQYSQQQMQTQYSQQQMQKQYSGLSQKEDIHKQQASAKYGGSGLKASTNIPSYQKNLQEKLSEEEHIFNAPPQIQQPVQPILKPVTTLKPGQYGPKTLDASFQPVSDDKHYLTSGSPLARSISPSLINHPAPTLPYYQADLVAHECAAVQSNVLDPTSPAISRSPSPMPGMGRSSSPFPRTMAKSPAAGPPPNPLADRYPKPQIVRDERYLEAKQNLTSYIPVYQERIEHSKKEFKTDKNSNYQSVSGLSQMESHQSQASVGQSVLGGQSKIAKQSDTYKNIQVAQTTTQQQDQNYRMSQTENLRHMEHLNKSQIHSTETSADNRIQIHRTKRVEEEFERTQKSKIIEIQKTGTGSNQVSQQIKGTSFVQQQQQQQQQIQQRATAAQQSSTMGHKIGGGVPQSGSNIYVLPTQLPQTSASRIPQKTGIVPAPGTVPPQPRSFSLPGSSASGPKQFKPSALASDPAKIPSSGPSIGSSRAPIGNQSASARPNMPQPYSGAAAGRQAGAIGVAPRRGRGILNLATGPGSRVPLCGHCNSHIRGPFITALGKIWCPEHFICTTPSCRRPLQDMGFVEERGQLYCEFCFEQYLAPLCAKCNSKIKGDCLNAIGKHFHPECFTCAYCSKLFGNSPFFLEDGLPYCEADWNELFTTKCFACGFPVEAGDRWVEALSNNYHSQCFNCTMCKKNLEGQSFYAKGGRPFCKNHAR